MKTGPVNTGAGTGRRAIAYPVNAALALLVTAVANAAVYVAGLEWFVQIPSIFVPIRNVGLVALVLIGGRLLMPTRNRSAQSFLLIAATLFGIGLALQFRLGHDAPRQLGDRETELVADTIRSHMQGAPEDSILAEVRSTVGSYNAALRRDFDQARIDLRLARSLQDEYGPSDTTAMFLSGRATAPMDSILFRLLPILGGLLTMLIFARTRLLGTVTAHWRAIGLYGSLGLCGVTFFYLGYVGEFAGPPLPHRNY